MCDVLRFSSYFPALILFCSLRPLPLLPHSPPSTFCTHTCMGVLPVFPICLPHLCIACGSQKKALDPAGHWLCHLGAGDYTWVFRKSSQCS